MPDNPLKRYLDRSFGQRTEAGQNHDAAEVDDFVAFGMLRGIRERACMLELRKKDGHILAVSYGFIRSVGFDPAEGIVLHLDDQKIRIRGKRLNLQSNPRPGLLHGIAQHRVLWVQETDRPHSVAVGATEAVIERIEW